jgi:hypothetical protein
VIHRYCDPCDQYWESEDFSEHQCHILEAVKYMNDYLAGVIAKLQKGEIVRHRGHGGSMEPLIKSGQLQILEPARQAELKVGDMVFCKVGKSVFTHKITAIKTEKEKLLFQISNNKGHVNGWTEHVYGRVVGLED